MNKMAICIGLILSLKAWALTCTTPVTLSESGQRVHWPEVKINDKGDSSVLWVFSGSDNDNDILVASTKDSEQKWSSVVISDTTDAIYREKLFIDDLGNNFAVWTENKDENISKSYSCFKFAKKENGRPWSNAVDIITPEDRPSFPKVVFDEQGDVFLFRTTYNPNRKWQTSYSVTADHYNHQTAEKKHIEISKDREHVGSAHLVKNEKGKVFASWEESIYHSGDQTEHLMKGSWYQGNGSWSDPVTITSSADGFYLSGFKADMNTRGDLVCLCQKSQIGQASSMQKIQVLTCFEGQWSEPLDLAVSNFHLPGSQIALSEDGYIFTSWQETKNGKNVVCVADKHRGGDWSSPKVLSDLNSDTVDYEMSMDNTGNILIVWRVREGRKKALYAVFKPVNEDWTIPKRLTDGKKICKNVRIESNPRGCFVVFWNEKYKKQFSIHGATLATATQEWSSSMLSPPGQDCEGFDCEFNKQGQGIIAWRTIGEDEDSYIQVAELNVN